jgi:phosphoribosylformimino-5-aminoimidazole carboxamide ribotide isomerase
LHDGTDPVALARSARDVLGLTDLYMADLDSILGESPANGELFRALRDLGLTLWVDAGVRGPEDVPALVEAGVVRIIVGLETARGPGALAKIVEAAGADRVVFSLDLHRGRPMIDTRAAWGTDEAAEIAARAIDAGVRRLIQLDLARVGTGRGVLTPEIRPSGRVEWIVGGGVAGIEDVRELAGAGFDGVLVGSALHGGRITVDDLESIKM